MCDYVAFASVIDMCSALIEVMPVGFTDYAFRMLSKSCSLWYYEIQSRIGGGK